MGSYCFIDSWRSIEMIDRIKIGTGYLYPLKVDEDGNEVDYISVFCEYWKGQKPEDCKRWSLQVGSNDEEWHASFDEALAAYRAM